MTQLGIASLALLLQMDTPEPPSFTAIWYREVLLGDVAGAASEYRKLFLSPPSEKLRPEIKQKAAFRAGLCSERLGQKDLARLAYTSVSSDELRTGLVVDEAILRLRSLTAEGGDGLEASAPSVKAAGVSAELAIQALRTSLEGVEKERSLAIAALESAVASRRDAERERLELMERLARSGVILDFPEAPPARSSAKDRDPAGRLLASMGFLGERLRVDDLSRVQDALAGDLAMKALRAVLVGNSHLARTTARRLEGLLGAGALSDGIRALDENGKDSRASSALAERRIEEETLRRAVALRRQVRALLDKAEVMASDRARPDLVVEDCEKVRNLLDWTDPALRESAEIRELANRATRLFLAAARPAGQEAVFARIWRVSRDQVARLIELSGETVRLAYEDIRFKGPARSPASAEALLACRAEAERLLAFAASELDQGRAGADFERSLREVMQLLQWVSALEDGREYRRRADSLLDAKAARATQQGSDRKDGKEPGKDSEEEGAEAGKTTR